VKFDAVVSIKMRDHVRYAPIVVADRSFSLIKGICPAIAWRVLDEARGKPWAAEKAARRITALGSWTDPL
jgi:hypothetical protein